MNRFSKLALHSCAILTLSMAADAQSRYAQPRGYGYGQGQPSVIGRVMTDLNRAASNSRLDNHERNHFEQVANNLRDFEAKFARGKFDTGNLDRAIGNLQHLADSDRIRGRERDLLARDADELRRFRAMRGGYNQAPGYYRR